MLRVAAGSPSTTPTRPIGTSTTRTVSTLSGASRGCSASLKMAPLHTYAARGSRIAFNYTYASDRNVNNPNSLYAQWGEPWLFGFPEDGAAPYVCCAWQPDRLQLHLRVRSERQQPEQSLRSVGRAVAVRLP